MTRASFNQGWTVRPKTSIFEALSSGAARDQPVRLPHDAALALERSATADGGTHTGYVPSAAVEYHKHFEVPESYRGRRVWVEFEAVYRDAMVYVNGDFAGQRPNGYTGFRIDLDPYLRYGRTNTIRVDARTHDDSRWYSGLGIYRDVWLTVTDPIHIAADGIRLTTPDIEADHAVVSAATTLINTSAETRTVTVTTELRDPSGALAAAGSAPITLRPGASDVVRQRLYVAKPALWNVDHPNLYNASTQITAGEHTLDSRDTTFGIRRLQLDPTRGLRINGETVKLRGACIHHDNGILGAATITRAEERRVELLKQAGFNAIRSAHNPLSRAMLDACDRHGMLVMDETFDVWTEGKSAHDYALDFPEWWKRDVQALIAKDFNHPSVIFYSIGNEIPETGTGLGAAWGRRLAETVRELDDTRFVTNGINGFVSALPELTPLLPQESTIGGVNAAMDALGEFMHDISMSPIVTEKIAESATVLDVLGLNYGQRRYELEHELAPDRILIGTETYPGDIAGNWDLVERHPYVLGDFTWTGWDYLGETGIGRPRYLGDEASFGAPFPWRLAWCGDIDITGFRRPASFYRETVFGLRHEPYIAVHRPETRGRSRIVGKWSWSDAIASWTWDVAPGTPMTVEVYSDADEVELLLNGRSIGRAAAGATNAFRAVFEVPYAAGEIIAAAYSDGREIARTMLRSAANDIHLAVTSERSTVRSDDGDVAFISAELRDASGILVTNRDRPVSIRIDGPATLQALGSARPDQGERYDSGTHTTFDGRVLAVVRPTGPGRATVHATASGCVPVSIELIITGDDEAAGAPSRRDRPRVTEKTEER